MRTRLVGLLVLAMLLFVPTVAFAEAASIDAVDLVLAVEPAGDHGEAPGLEPRGPNDEDNAFAPEAYDRPWTWWMAPLILFPTLGIIALIGALYYFQVYRPAQQAPAKK